MRQRISLLIVALIALWLLGAACAAPAGQSYRVQPTAEPAKPAVIEKATKFVPSQPPAAGQAKITFSSWATNAHEVWAIEMLVEQFRKQTGIIVEYDIVR